MVQVKVPTPLRKYTGGAGGVEAEGATVAALVNDLERRHPGLKERICDESGQVRRFVNLFVNRRGIPFLKHPDTPLQAGAGEAILPPAPRGGDGAGWLRARPPPPARPAAREAPRPSPRPP